MPMPSLVSPFRQLAVLSVTVLVVAIPFWFWLGGPCRALFPWDVWQEIEEGDQALERMQTVRHWRITAKVHIRGELLQGRIELRQALALIRWCNQKPDGYPLFCPVGTPLDRWACQELLWGCETTPADSPPAVLDRAQLVMAQLRLLLASSETLVLPEPPELPGMPPCPPCAPLLE